MRRHLWRTVPVVATMALGFGLAASPAEAAAITFVANGSSSDGALSASANFTTKPGELDLTLTNLLSASSIRSAGQTLSDITFTLSNLAGTLTGDSATGQLGNVNGSGLVTYTTGTPSRFLGNGPPPPGGTGTFLITANSITLEALGGGQPSELIAPAIANGGTYTNVNNGFQNFDPYTIGPATFVLDLSGVTANTTVTSAIFSFGTGPDMFVPGVVCTTNCGGTSGGPPGSVPEPSPVFLVAAGLLGLGYFAQRRQATL